MTRPSRAIYSSASNARHHRRTAPEEQQAIGAAVNTTDSDILRATNPKPASRYLKVPRLAAVPVVGRTWAYRRAVAKAVEFPRTSLMKAGIGRRPAMAPESYSSQSNFRFCTRENSIGWHASAKPPKGKIWIPPNLSAPQAHALGRPMARAGLTLDGHRYYPA